MDHRLSAVRDRILFSTRQWSPSPAATPTPWGHTAVKRQKLSQFEFLAKETHQNYQKKKLL